MGIKVALTIYQGKTGNPWQSENSSEFSIDTPEKTGMPCGVSHLPAGESHPAGNYVFPRRYAFTAREFLVVYQIIRTIPGVPIPVPLPPT
jgi:hypothetical protein